MADIFASEQARRLFGRIAAGASLGGLAGPLLSGLLVAPMSYAGLLLVSTALLLATLLCVRFLFHWQRTHGKPGAAAPSERPIGGNIWAGITIVLRSPYLLAISLFVILLTSVTTFLYFEQARVVQAAFPDPIRQTQVFSAIDTVVQSLTIFIQIFLTGQIAKRLGVSALLVGVPLLMVLGFGLLAAAATFPILAIVMILRRVGEYALVRPGREIVFTAVDAETKYKAKNAIDTFVYRGGDVVSAWANAGIVALGSVTAAAIVGAVIAMLWAAVGLFVGRRHDRITAHHV